MNHDDAVGLVSASGLSIALAMLDDPEVTGAQHDFEIEFAHFTAEKLAEIRQGFFDARTMGIGYTSKVLKRIIPDVVHMLPSGAPDVWSLVLAQPEKSASAERAVQLAGLLVAILSYSGIAAQTNELRQQGDDKGREIFNRVVDRIDKQRPFGP